MWGRFGEVVGTFEEVLGSYLGSVGDVFRRRPTCLSQIKHLKHISNHTLMNVNEFCNVSVLSFIVDVLGVRKVT